MTPQELKIEIETGPLAAELAGKSDNEIADVLNDTSRFTLVKERFITARTLLAELGPTVGASVLDKLEAVSAVSSPVKWAMKFLATDGIDMGHAGTRAQMDALAQAGALTAEEAEAVKAIAEQPASRAEILGWGSVSYNDVNAARSL